MRAKKCFLLLLLLFVFAFPVHAFDDGEVLIANITHSVVGGAAAEGPAMQWFSESFTGSGPGLNDETDWTVLSPDYQDDLEIDTTNDELWHDYNNFNSRYDDYMAIYGTATTTDDQCCIIQVTDINGGVAVGERSGCVFRAQTSSAGEGYAVHIKTASGGDFFHVYKHDSAGDMGASLHEDATDQDIVDGDYVGAAVKGAYLYFWDFGASGYPSGCPSSCPAWDGDTTGSSNWGAYTEISAEMTGGDLISTGKYVGISIYTGQGDTDMKWDDWWGGDVND